MIPKDADDPPEPQQLGYVNVVPSRNEYGTFDSFGTTIKKFNAHLQQKPLPGMYVYSKIPSAHFNKKKLFKIV